MPTALFTRRHALALALAAPFVPQVAQADARVISAPDGRALGGYDAVSYFFEGVPRVGAADQALRWRGAIWQFATLANRLTFEANPRAFAPRFGGYCAWSMSQGHLELASPLAFALHGGRLFMARDPGALARWRTDIPGHIAAAEAHWPGILKQ
jgi:hypothetical protein